jgi:hypothetical protein
MLAAEDRPLAYFDLKKSGAPLLVIAGTNAHVIAASLSRSNFAKHQRSRSVTYFKECLRRTHFILGQTNWEKVADYVFTWIGRINYEHQNTPLSGVPSCIGNELLHSLVSPIHAASPAHI